VEICEVDLLAIKRYLFINDLLLLYKNVLKKYSRPYKVYIHLKVTVSETFVNFVNMWTLRDAIKKEVVMKCFRTFSNLKIAARIIL